MFFAQAERIAAYNQEKTSLSKWDPIVEKYRTVSICRSPYSDSGQSRIGLVQSQIDLNPSMAYEIYIRFYSSQLNSII